MKLFETLFGTNWRTSMAGYGGAIFTAILPLLENGTFDIHKDWKNLVIASGIALFGRVAKDSAVTGLPKRDTDNGTTTV